MPFFNMAICFCCLRCREKDASLIRFMKLSTRKRTKGTNRCVFDHIGTGLLQAADLLAIEGHVQSVCGALVDRLFGDVRVPRPDLELTQQDANVMRNELQQVLPHLLEVHLSSGWQLTCRTYISEPFLRNDTVSVSMQYKRSLKH
jgi:hypothetical protein